MNENEPSQALVHSDAREVMGALSAKDVRAQVTVIQQIYREVMIKDTHYGTIPGTKKPSLWKAGAEKICMTFHIAIENVIDADLSSADVVRYRVRAIATSQATGTFLGSALGECSSDEEKYRWRAAVCKEEFEETPDDRKRRKWKTSDSGAFMIPQVRAEPSDIANTVLKMAVKRAQIAVVLQVGAVSDIFTQDLEDLPPEVRNEVVNGDKDLRDKKTDDASDKKTEGNGGGGPVISEAQRNRAFAIGKSSNYTVDQYRAVIKKHGFDSDKTITKDKYDAIVKELQGPPA
jgi:hypothetical protein